MMYLETGSKKIGIWNVACLGSNLACIAEIETKHVAPLHPYWQYWTKNVVVMTVTWWPVGRQGIDTKGDTVQKRINTLAGAWHVDSYMATAVPLTTLDLVGRPVTQVAGVTLCSRRRHPRVGEFERHHIQRQTCASISNICATGDWPHGTPQ